MQTDARTPQLFMDTGSAEIGTCALPGDIAQLDHRKQGMTTTTLWGREVLTAVVDCVTNYQLAGSSRLSAWPHSAPAERLAYAADH